MLNVNIYYNGICRMLMVILEYPVTQMSVELCCLTFMG